MLRSLIDGAHNIVICCHVNPDGDAIGSSLGWAEYLKTLGKEPAIVVPDQFPRKPRFGNGPANAAA